MPKTPVDENGGVPFWKDQIRFSGQLGMKSEPETLCMEKFAQKDFRLCVFAANARHHPASHFGRYDISQRRGASSR
jgi:hypothetical protein